MKLTAITTACARPEAWALSESYMKRQTRQPDQWLCLDDDEPKTVCTMGQTYIHNPSWKGRGSLTAKVRHALKEGLIKGDAVVFWENDDWYAPDYLKAVEKWLETHELVGEGRSIYYNVALRYWYDHPNMGHASLCSTAVRRECFNHLMTATNTDDPFIDSRLWNIARKSKRVFDPTSHGYGRLVLGIKGMPGTGGYGSGHTAKHQTNNADPQLKKLQSLIGDDALKYERFAPSLPKAKLIRNVAKSECGRVHGENWLDWLGHLTGKNAWGLEIGTFKGESAEWWMDNILTHKTANLVCVDSWKGGDEHKREKTDFGAVEAEMWLRLKPYSDRVSVKKGLSFQRLTEIRSADMQFDFVYVDAAHDALNVLRDAVLSFDMLKVGGVMIFDDYSWGDMPRFQDRPKTGVDAFLSAYADEIDILHTGYQVAVKKVEHSPFEGRRKLPPVAPATHQHPPRPGVKIFQFMGPPKVESQ